METIINNLKNWGCNTEDALDRMLQDKQMYMQLLIKYKDTLQLKELKIAVQAKNYDKAFDIIHEIKNVTGDLGITPIFEIALEMSRQIKNKKFDKLDELTNQLIINGEKLNKILSK